MSRLFGSFVAGSLFLFSFAVSAGATPIVGGAIGVSHSFKSNVGGVFSSSLNADSAGNNNHEFHGPQGLGQGTGFGPHQFVERVPPPASETPEPSTLALFGTGLTMLAGAVRKRLGRQSCDN
jgi:PEP-CTERM motif